MTGVARGGAEGAGFDPEAVRDALEALHIRSPGPRQAATRRIGAATGQLIEKLVDSSASSEALGEVGQQLEAVVRRLPELEGGRLYEGYADSAMARRPSAFFDWSPMLGVANPLAPPAHASRGRDRVRGGNR
jgi:hypothetical protein